MLFRSHAPAWVPGFSNSQPKSLSRPATLSHPPPSSPPAVPSLALSNSFSSPSHHPLNLLSASFLAFFPSSLRLLFAVSFLRLLVVIFNCLLKHYIIFSHVPPALSPSRTSAGRKEGPPPPKNESRPPTAFPFLSLFFRFFPLSFSSSSASLLPLLDLSTSTLRLSSAARSSSSSVRLPSPSPSHHLSRLSRFSFSLSSSLRLCFFLVVF